MKEGRFLKIAVTKNNAMKLWNDVFDNVDWAKDCFGTWMFKDAYSNEEVMMTWPNDGIKYDVRWNVDHIRLISDFKNPKDADFWNYYEPMHRQNNQEKGDNYTGFQIGNNSFQVIRCYGYYGYGIKDSNGNRIDWKGDYNIFNTGLIDNIDRFFSLIYR